MTDQYDHAADLAEDYLCRAEEGHTRPGEPDHRPEPEYRDPDPACQACEGDGIVYSGNLDVGDVDCPCTVAVRR